MAIHAIANPTSNAKSLICHLFRRSILPEERMTAMNEQMIVKKVRLAKYMAVADCAFMYHSVRATSTNAEQHVSCDDISPQLLYSCLVLTKDSTSSANLSAPATLITQAAQKASDRILDTTLDVNCEFL